MKNQYTNSLTLLAIGALIAAAPGPAQSLTRASAIGTLGVSPVAVSPAAAAVVDTAGDKGRTSSAPSPELQKRIRDLVASSLPAYDKRLLTTYETASPWEDNLSYQYLNKLLGETPFDWEGKSVPPADADRLEDKSKAMRIRRADGNFRYHSRKRAFTADLKGKAAPSFDQVSRQMGDLLGNLRFPLNEADKGDVKTQEMAVSGESGQVAERFPTYAYFIMDRRIEGIPVEGSTVRASVNLKGEVQRMKIAWPHFRVRPKAELRPRERVLEEAVQKVFAQSPTEKITLASRLVYAKSAKGDFLPAVQVDVSDGETPYRMTIPVAQ